MKIPKGMLPVEEFVNNRGVNKEKVTQMIKGGFHAG